MKLHTIFIFLLIILLTSCSSEEHLIFNDVPIDGHLDKFANELTKAGFIRSDTLLKNEIILNGKFLNKECKISVFGTSKNNVAYKVIAELPTEVKDSLQYSFENMQKLLSAKYGNGKTRYQQYKNPARFLFNEPKLKRQIREGDLTRYITVSGEITLEVEHGYISITYLDNLNDELRKREKAEEDK